MLQFLIADDHAVMRQAIMEIIKDDWPQAIFEEASDGGELVQKALQRKWDMVISDISMPAINGLEALEIIKRHAPELPVLIVSIHTEKGYAVRALKSGAVAFIPKILVQQELADVIRSTLFAAK